MIPDKKKSNKEIAALREALGIQISTHEPAPAETHTDSYRSIERAAESTRPSPSTPTERNILTGLEPINQNIRTIQTKPTRSLRKSELPLAPAPTTSHRIELPTKRHDARDIGQIRKDVVLAAFHKPESDLTAHLRSQRASPFLYSPGYILAITSAISAYFSMPYIIPTCLLSLATLIMVFITLRRPRSHHHAALLFTMIFLILVFGSLHYAPLFQNAP